MPGDLDTPLAGGRSPYLHPKQGTGRAILFLRSGEMKMIAFAKEGGKPSRALKVGRAQLFSEREWKSTPHETEAIN